MTPALLAYWVAPVKPFLIQFTDDFGLRYYGLAYVMGFLFAGWMLRKYALAGRSALPVDAIADFMMGIVIGVLVGGRLGYFLLYQIGSLGSHPLELFRVWEGGMSSHGGFVGVTVAMWWFSRKRKIPFLHLADLITSAAAAGLLFGRLANFINGELWGKISYVSWAMIFPRSAPPGTALADMPPRHPSQLYEAALEGVLLLAYMQWRFWRSDVVKRHPGRLAAEFLIVYAIVRVICEIFREPDEGIALVFGLSRGTFYSLFLIATGITVILWPRTEKR